jgi:branched-chain amino acid transport system permease protein
MLAQQLVNGIVVGSVYALFALGFTLVFGVHHILNLAHGSVSMWGAFVGLIAVAPSALWPETSLPTPFLPLPLAFILAMLSGGLIGVLLDLVAFRPLRKRKASEFAALVSSIGASLILLSVAQQLSRTGILRFPFDTFPVEIFRFAGMRMSLLQITILVSVGVLFFALVLYLYRTSFGRQVRAVAVNERTATLLGVNPTAVYLQIFFISGALAGAAGVLIGLAFNSVHFLMGEPYLLRAFVVVVLGGLGSVIGAVVAGLALGLIQTLTVVYISSGLSDAIIFSILFLMLLIKPTGFFPGLRRDSRVVRT